MRVIFYTDLRARILTDTIKLKKISKSADIRKSRDFDMLLTVVEENMSDSVNVKLYHAD